MGVDRSILCSSFIILMIFSYRPVSVKGQTLTTNFYSVACPLAESIVQTTMKSAFILEQNIAAFMQQLHYIDCFIQGCDASVLISGPNTEKTAVANLSLYGFQVIDDIKRLIELVCPGVVSCADILALAAREAVVLAKGPYWEVKLGRKDGKVSLAANIKSLPSQTDSITERLRIFASYGLNTEDFVALIGAHTIGSELVFDTSIFENIFNGSAVLKIDQSLSNITTIYRITQEFVTKKRFETVFKRAMARMSEIRVKTWLNGEIRRNCSRVN